MLTVNSKTQMIKNKPVRLLADKFQNSMIKCSEKNIVDVQVL